MPERAKGVEKVDPAGVLEDKAVKEGKEVPDLGWEAATGLAARREMRAETTGAMPVGERWEGGDWRGGPRTP